MHVWNNNNNVITGFFFLQSVGNLSIQMETERLLVKQHALELQELTRTASLINTSSSAKTLTKRQKPK